MTHVIDVTQLHKRFGKTEIVKDVNFQLEQGELISIVGPSGSGKTTLLRMLAGLEPVTSGAVLLNGKDVTDRKANARNIGLVFQQPLLFPHMTVEENISYGVRVAGKNAGDKAKKLLQAISLSEYGGHFPAELSGGQQQRVALARAIATEPEVLLLDEPFSSLDAQLREELRYWVRDLLKTHQITAVFVTHDLEEAMLMGDRIALFHEGIFQQFAAADEIHEKPANPFVARFLKGHLVLNNEQYSPISALTLTEPVKQHRAFKAQLLHTTYSQGQKLGHLFIEEINEKITLPLTVNEHRDTFSIYLPLERICSFSTRMGNPL
ncbi:ABC transporter ATP-binding protein [Halobacillus shinanisalinarum]|uniref:ABC transporter ATP-binding protein n=1 Tax=Halobacillus shinanisalinarum TaxID=2932258 RepID=A0ABY4GUD5_9BACI|nr:ABC transporter ATP-binding protein [Halobacillus shinanisalinarum]UOQ91766.1 ABC transporter ATP-binding protein [Halobacillus shinanisalinarum]